MRQRRIGNFQARGRNVAASFHLRSAGVRVEKDRKGLRERAEDLSSKRRAHSWRFLRRGSANTRRDCQQFFASRLLRWANRRGGLARRGRARWRSSPRFQEAGESGRRVRRRGRGLFLFGNRILRDAWRVAARGGRSETTGMDDWELREDWLGESFQACSSCWRECRPEFRRRGRRSQGSFLFDREMHRGGRRRRRREGGRAEWEDGSTRGHVREEAANGKRARRRPWDGRRSRRHGGSRGR